MIDREVASSGTVTAGDATAEPHRAVGSWVTFESRYSGFGMNPARTVASALPAGDWTAIWLYVVSPVAGMLLAAQLFTIRKALCAKIYQHGTSFCAHARPEDGPARCIFCRDRVVGQ